jgi:WD40 repeat protein
MNQIVTQTTALAFFKEFILIGQGHRLIVKGRSHYQQIRTNHRIHSIKISNFIYLIGQKQLTILDFDFHLIKNLQCRDWIQDILTVSDKMYILFSHNSVDELDLDFNLKRTIACENKSLLYSGQLFYDGKLKIVSGTIYNEALIWDLKGKVSQRLIGHEGVLFRCRFDVTGNRLVTCSDDRTVRIWDLAFEPYHGHTNIEASVILHGHTGRVWDAAFVGNYIVSVSEDASCRVWDLTGNCIAVWEGHGSKSVWCFDSNLKYVVTGGGDGGVRLWNLEQLHENRITRDSQLQICNTEFQENLTKQEKEPKHFKIVDANRFFIVTEVGSFLLYDRLTNTPKLLHQDPLFRLSPQLAVCHDLGFCANMNGLLVVMQLNGSKVDQVNLASNISARQRKSEWLV